MSEERRLTHAELLDRLREAAVPSPGFYRHYKGGRYLVTGVAVRESDGEALVLYEPFEAPLTFARPASEWGDTVEHEGRTVPRFVRA